MRTRDGWLVEQGDCIHSIASQLGIDWEQLWDANPELRATRKHPNVLMPGDVVRIPDIQRARHAAPTGKTTRFRASLPQLELRFALQDKGKPRPHIRCVARFGGKEHERTSDGDGHVDVPIDPDDDYGTLTAFPPDGPPEVYGIRIGWLDPIAEVTGIQARLRHLGYDVGPVDGSFGPRTRKAVQRFQARCKLPVTGEVDDATRSRLAATHGES